MRPLYEPFLLHVIPWLICHRTPIGLHRPLGLRQEILGRHRAADRMDHEIFRRTEATRQISTSFLNSPLHVHDFKIACLQKSGHKVLRQIIADARVRQGTCPEFLGIVSRELFDREIPRHLKNEQQLVVLTCCRRSRLKVLHPIDSRPKCSIRSTRCCRTRLGSRTVC